MTQSISQDNPSTDDRDRDRKFAHDDMAVADLMTLMNHNSEKLMGSIVDILDIKLKLELQRNEINFRANIALRSDDPEIMRHALEEIARLTIK